MNLIFPWSQLSTSNLNPCRNLLKQRHRKNDRRRECGLLKPRHGNRRRWHWRRRRCGELLPKEGMDEGWPGEAIETYWNTIKTGCYCVFFLETRSSFPLGRFCIERFEIAGLRMFGRQWIWFKTWSRDHWGRLRRTSYRRRWMLDLMKVRWHHVVSTDPTPWNVKGIIVPWSQIWGWSVKIGS